MGENAISTTELQNSNADFIVYWIGTNSRAATVYQWAVYEHWRMCETLDNVPVSAVSGLFYCQIH